MATPDAARQARLAFWKAQVKANPDLRKLALPRITSYMIHKPTPRQAVFLGLPHQEIMYGGAAGGGKTDALLDAALQYVDIPGYNALLLRRTYGQLSKADSILARAHEWLRGTDARFSANDHQYVFPAGATLQFGYLQHFKDVYQYDGPSYQFIGFDELTQFTEDQYRFLFSRLRRLSGSKVPLRMRSATNPGGVGHLWVKERFIKSTAKTRAFVPATLLDNPYLDVESYRGSLAELDPILQKQREFGDWDVEREGMVFRREWFRTPIATAPRDCYRFRYWDLAATAPKPGKDPDYTVGVLLARDRASKFYVEDVRRGRFDPGGVEQLICQTARMDGRAVKVRLEQEGGASGKYLIDSFKRLLIGFDVEGVPSARSKLSRWMPVAAQCQAGNLVLVSGPWNSEFVDEICNLAGRDDVHDDQADALSGAFNCHVEEPMVAFGVSRIGGRAQ